MEKTCILCGRKRPVGLHIGGCLLCFDCERAMLAPSRRLLRGKRRRRLALLYGAEG